MDFGLSSEGAFNIGPDFDRDQEPIGGRPAPRPLSVPGSGSAQSTNSITTKPITINAPNAHASALKYRSMNRAMDGPNR